MIAPTKLSDWPWVVVRVDCVLCQRRGCYRLARLAARYGPEQSMTGLLADLAQTCPWWRTNPRKYEPRCGARFVDLARNLPPPDDPQAAVYRQKQPSRENVPARPATPVPGHGSPVPMLSGWPAALVTIVCARCGRRTSFDKEDLLATGGDVRLTELRVILTADCPRRLETSIYELCAVRFETPDEDNP